MSASVLLKSQIINKFLVMAERKNATSRFDFNNEPVRPRKGFKSSALPEYRIQHVVEIINIPTVIHFNRFWTN